MTSQELTRARIESGSTNIQHLELIFAGGRPDVEDEILRNLVRRDVEALRLASPILASSPTLMEFLTEDTRRVRRVWPRCEVEIYTHIGPPGHCHASAQTNCTTIQRCRDTEHNSSPHYFCAQHAEPDPDWHSGNSPFSDGVYSWIPRVCNHCTNHAISHAEEHKSRDEGPCDKFCQCMIRFYELMAEGWCKNCSQDVQMEASQNFAINFAHWDLHTSAGQSPPCFQCQRPIENPRYPSKPEWCSLCNKPEFPGL